MKTNSAKIMELARSQILRPRDLKELKYPRQALSELVQSGDLIRTARGLYIASDFDLSQHHSFAEVSKRWPRAVISLLSALQFHEISLELPSEVWIAVPRGYSPRSNDMHLRILQFSNNTINVGIENHMIEGVSVKIYSAAKTVADCFKFRNQIGNTVAYEALKNTWEKQKASADEIVKYAKICRVYSVMRPYLETLV